MTLSIFVGFFWLFFRTVFVGVGDFWVPFRLGPPVVRDSVHTQRFLNTILIGARPWWRVRHPRKKEGGGVSNF